MSIESKLTEVFENNSISFKVNAKSFILQCPLCDKTDGVYLWRNTGFGRCHKCTHEYSPQSFLVSVIGCSYHEARKLLYTGVLVRPKPTLEAHLGKKTTKKAPIKEFVMPYNFFKLDGSSRVNDGEKYLLDRGVKLEVARQFDVRYCPATKRIIFPVFQERKCVGWQARDTTGKSELRYTSPSGFNRSQSLLGYQQSYNSNHLVVVEGPFDFLQVAILGGAVCTFGKEISKPQMEMIKKHPAKKIYLGLDPDAQSYNDTYASFFQPEKEVLIIQPPSHREDFGECTEKEIEESFLFSRIHAKGSFLSLNLKE